MLRKLDSLDPSALSTIDCFTQQLGNRVKQVDFDILCKAQ